jgi:hypothetical protein
VDLYFLKSGSLPDSVARFCGATALGCFSDTC